MDTENKEIQYSKKIVLEKMSDEKMQQMFGVKYQAVLAYNFDLKKWNTNQYMGKSVSNEADNTLYANKLKAYVETLPCCKDYDLVALAFMSIAPEEFTKVGRLRYSPKFCMRKYSFDGHALAATMIFRDWRTGKILPLSNSWFCANKTRTRKVLLKTSVPSFVNVMTNDSYVRLVAMPIVLGQCR